MTDPATHPTLAALLQAVLADPGDDAPRLVYADWLGEYGDEGDALRGEFIRVQCRVAEMMRLYDPVSPLPKNHPAHPEWKTLRRRERELLAACADALSLSFPERIGFGSLEFLPGEALAYRRGFVEAVTCTAADWVAHAAAILKAQPVTAVTLTTWPGEELTALTVSRPAALADPAELEGLFGETSATRWCLRRLWPGVTFTLPARNVVWGRDATAHVNRGTPREPRWVPPLPAPAPEAPDP